MFACVHWTGSNFDQSVLAAVPNRSLCCYFLPNTLLFRVPDVTAFLDVRARLSRLANTAPTFDFSLSLHTSLDTFGGQAFYQLPTNFNDIVMP